MAKNIMSLVNLNNRVSRNGFDLSQRNAFTAKAGELLPVYFSETLPGDKFRMNLDWFTRTQPLNTAAFTRLKQYVDVFFVPTNLLWNRFNSFVTQMVGNPQKAQSISEQVKVPSQQPYVTWSSIWSRLDDVAKSEDNLDVCGQYRAAQSIKLLSYLGYGDFSAPNAPFFGTDMTDFIMNPFPLMAYQKIYMDFYRDQQWENAAPYTCNCDYAGYNDSTPLELPLTDAPTSSNDMTTLRYRNWAKDYFMGLLPSTQFGFGGSVAVNGTATASLTGFIPLTAQSSLQLNGTYSVGGAGVFLANDPTNVNRLIKQDDGSVTSALIGTDLSNANKVNSALSGNFSILALRRAEAAQKWAEITLSNQQDYAHQTEAHFDKPVSDAYSDHVQYIGGTTSVLDISEVVNTNLNGGEDSINTNSASISGKGSGAGNGYIEFEAPVHGYLMVIYSCCPLLDYDINGIERINLKNVPTDYAIPEYDRTGMVSVPISEFVMSSQQTDVEITADWPLGYGPQYQEYKIKYDVVRGAFSKGGLNSWCAPMTTDYFLAMLKKYSYVPSYYLRKVNPSVLDTVFAVDAVPVSDNLPDPSASNYLSEVYKATVSTDQLLINFFTDCKAVRPLDRNGLPY